MNLAKCININDPEAVANATYPYCPNLGAAVFFSALFGLLTIAHVIQAIWYRKKYCWVIAMAAAWETIGWATRAASTQHLDARQAIASNLAIVTQVFVLVAPIWLNAFVYMTFGRMVLYFLPEQRIARISARRLTLLFVMLDIIAFITQVAGALLLTETDAPQSTTEAGIHTYMGGIAFQEFFILCFLSLTILFRRRAMRYPTHRLPQRWDYLLYLLWGALALISIRIFFRLGEYSQGFNSYGGTHEWLEYTFDALPMFVAMAAFNVYHPARALVGPESEFPKKPSRAARKAARAAEAAEELKGISRDGQGSSMTMDNITGLENVV